MPLTPSQAKVATFAIPFLAVGLTMWTTPYAQANIPNSFGLFGSLVVFATAAWFTGSGKGPVFKAILLSGLSPAACYMARVLVETLFHPTRHNLWPLALLLAAVAGMAIAAVGAVAGYLFIRSGRRQ